MLNNITQKICIKCHNPKDLDRFSRDSSYSDGLRSACNECRNAKRRENRVTASATTITVAKHIQPVFAPYSMTPCDQDLPDPDRLPAAYLKRCSDYWVELVGGNTPQTRLA